jgi:hypothetical protein
MPEWEPAERELVLVGTVHRDPTGFAKLAGLLARERPAVVAVELSPYGLAFRYREGRCLRRRLGRRLRRRTVARGGAWWRRGEFRAIDLQLQVPFEYRAAVRYCRDMGAALHLIDLSSWSREAIHNQWPGLVSAENLEHISAGPTAELDRLVRRDYELAARLLSEPGTPPIPAFHRSWAEDPTWEERETVLAARLAELFGEMDAGRLVYIGGWQHLLAAPDCGTLYDRVSHLRPRRMLLLHGHRGNIGRQELGPWSC